MEAAREQLSRLQARESLTEFVRFTKPDYEFASHHRQIIAALEAAERGDCPRLIIEAPPRHGKSELVSRRFPAWFIGRNPRKEIICASYSGDLAVDFGREVRNIVGGADFRAVFDGVSLRSDSTAANRWHTNQGGIYVSVGVEGPATGRGFHLGVVDDPFKSQADADSEVKSENVWKWYTSVFLLRQMPGAAIIITATRWAENDLTGRILEKAKETGEHWEIVKLPALNEYDQALWPERYPVEHLRLIKGTIPARQWLSLYQQQPTADEGIQFKREWFRNRYSKLPESLNYYVSADLAVTPDAGDRTEIAVWSVDEIGMIRPVRWWTGRVESLEWAKIICDLMDEFGALRFIAESGLIRRACEPILREEMRKSGKWFTIEWLPTTSNKQAMARSFEALCYNGRVEFPQAVWAEEVITQLLKFTGAEGAVDDKVDACSVFGRYIHETWEPPAPKKPAPTLHQVLDKEMTFRELMPIRKRRDD